MSKDTLASFLAQLTTDADLQAKFRADPDGVMKAAGLTAEESQLLRSGDAQKISDYLGGEGPVAGVIVFI
jgi:hypothetical protein